MRTLHTADWHVGRTIRGRSRSAEHTAVLTEIVELAAAERVDLVVVAGDVFDTAAPSPDAERVVYRALADLAAVAPVVVVAGNHDSPQRLAAVSPLLAANRVTVAAALARPDEGGVVELTAGGTPVRLALVPFLSQRAIVRADDLLALDADQHAGKYAARSAAVIAALAQGFTPDAVNLVVAHLFVTGATVGGGERSAHTVFDYAVPATALPASAHYVALGHLHRTQRVPAACPAWYAGSPLQLDFGETANTSAVVLVDAEPGTPAAVRVEPLTAGRRLRTLQGTLGQLEALAGTTGGDHLRVLVESDARAGLAEQVREWFPEAVEIVTRASESAGPIEVERLGRSAAELFAEYLADRGAADERVTALFAELLDDASAPD